jgi:exodeoxyribonuclease III
MKICTWNVNSLKARAEYVTRFLDAEAPDVLCLQELKLTTEAVPRELFEERGYQLAVHGQRQWNGVLIAAKGRAITDVHCGLPLGDDGQARLVAGTVDGIRLVNLYCPQGQSEDSPKFTYKLRFFDVLCEWLAEHHDPADPLLVLGDINIAPSADDLWDPERFRNVPSFHPLEHERWAKLLDLGLTDVVRPHIEPGTYTFWDYRAGSFRYGKGMRIDHLLATPPVAERVQGAWVGRDWRKKVDGLTPSDHAPVFIELG